LAVNALYWMGECRYSLQDYTGAVSVFKGLVEKYPRGIKVPDALLKIAYSHLSLDDTDRALHYLKNLVKQYPFSSAGEKAAERLKEIN
ncbi:MAG: tetratricopeptide repeat protein, partial [Desulfamplus sp.]|nr:tetratricopeptide repeat protein [Desulfamplus sp.]